MCQEKPHLFFFICCVFLHLAIAVLPVGIMRFQPPILAKVLVQGDVFDCHSFSPFPLPTSISLVASVSDRHNLLKWWKKCGHRSPANRSLARTKLAAIRRISSSLLPQPPAHFSDGTRRILCSGPPPEPRRAVRALLKLPRNFPRSERCRSLSAASVFNVDELRAKGLGFALQIR